MGPRLFLHLYTIASMVEIFARTSGRDDLEMIVKPLLMPLLIIWFVRSAAIISPLERWTIIALIFSWSSRDAPEVTEYSRARVIFIWHFPAVGARQECVAP